MPHTARTMFNDLLNLLKFFTRFMVAGAVLIATAIYGLISLADSAWLPVLVVVVPAAVVLWAFRPKQPR